jgi:hypothetical protein
MLDGPDSYAEGAERRRRAPVDDMLDVGRDERPVSGPEENACIGGCGGECQLDRFTGMKPNALYGNLPPDGPLEAHSVPRIKQRGCQGWPCLLNTCFI